MPKIYILLPVHNRKEITRKFIKCLKAQTFSDYKLLLIDDGSTDGTAEMVQKNIPSVTTLRGTGDWWWAGSLQQGLNWLKKRQIRLDSLILFINDDVTFGSNYLECALRVMAGKKGTLVLSRHKSPDRDNIFESGVSADLRRLSFKKANSSEQINCLSTMGLFVYWADICSIGNFHPILLPHYLSDYEYTIRAHKKGFKCNTNPALFIVPNYSTPGYHQFDGDKFIDFFKKYFSKKSAENPLYWSSFILLTSELRWILPNLIKVWLRAGKTIIKAFIENIHFSVSAK